MTNGPLRSALLAAALGAVAALGLAPFDLWFLTLPALVALSWLFLQTRGWRQAAWLGWSFGLGYFALGLMWIVEPFLVDIRRHGWMAPFGLIFMAGGLALFWAAGFGAARAVGRGPWARVLALIAVWSLAEFGRAYLLTGFPWAALAQIWVTTDAALLLAWVGPHGLALWTLAAALPLALLRRARLLAVLPGAALLAATVWSGQTAPEVTFTGQTVRVVQPNAPQHLKWHPDHIPVFFARHLSLTAQPAEVTPDLIVWPETSIPTFLHHSGPQIAAIAQAASGVPVVAGAQRLEGSRLYNALVVIGSDGQITGQYDKHHLVPFGEYVPLGDLAARLGIRGFASGAGEGFSRGPGPALLDLPGIGPALPLICYEAVFPQDATGAPGRAALLLQITNDAWFGTWSGPYQHLAQARMRAIEQGLPMIRAANTGISAVIDPLGRVLQALPLNSSGALDAPLPRPHAPTVYAQTGDWPVFVLILALCAVLVLLQMRAAGAKGD